MTKIHNKAQKRDAEKHRAPWLEREWGQVHLHKIQGLIPDPYTRHHGHTWTDDAVGRGINIDPVRMMTHNKSVNRMS